jgi:hypothetical protein
MHVQVICGVKEEYKPSEKVTKIAELVESLREERNTFKNDIMAPKMQEIEALVNEVNKPNTPQEKTKTETEQINQPT